jgi:hypothetical protein
MHRSQPQHHLSFPSYEIFPIKSSWFHTAANPVMENCLKFGFWIVRKLGNLHIILIQKNDGLKMMTYI